MANIFKRVTISDELAYLTPLRPADQNSRIPAARPRDPEIQLQSEIHGSRGRAAGIRVRESAEPFVGPMPDGLAQERTLLQEQSNTLNALLQSIPNAINENRQQMSSEIADIVLLIASKFFINQQQDKDAISHQITQIISQLNDKQNIEITLHPHDLALIQQGEIKLDIRSCKNMRLIPDETLGLGGCLINSEHGVFDAGIERQIDNLKQVLLQMRAKHE